MDTATKTKAANDAIGSGAMSPNEAREKLLGLEPVAGGDTPYLQQQYQSLEAAAKRDNAPPAHADAGARTDARRRAGRGAVMLVTLAQAKGHLRLTWADGDPRDADLQLKLDSAEAIILDACNATVYWRDVTRDAGRIPPRSRSASTRRSCSSSPSCGRTAATNAATTGRRRGSICRNASARCCTLYRDPVLG